MSSRGGTAPEPFTAIFEPWGLGDALIAAAVVREAPTRFTLFCNSRWHPLIRAATKGAIQLQDAEGIYTHRTGTRSLMLFLKSLLGTAEVASGSHRRVSRVLSIRGDPRDWLLIKKIFPGIKIKMNGWLCFLAKQCPPIDWLFQMGILRVQNRYLRWERMARLPKGDLEASYLARRAIKPTAKSNLKFVIHVGAQWRSKQYPFVLDLNTLLLKLGHRVSILAGPKDQLPLGITEDMVDRPTPEALIALFESADWVIANDSGPMHLAAFLGARTAVTAMVSNIAEWLPPGVIAISSEEMPKGYRPREKYASDDVLEGWSEPERVVQMLL